MVGRMRDFETYYALREQPMSEQSIAFVEKSAAAFGTRRDMTCLLELRFLAARLAG